MEREREIREGERKRESIEALAIDESVSRAPSYRRFLSADDSEASHGYRQQSGFSE